MNSVMILEALFLVLGAAPAPPPSPADPAVAAAAAEGKAAEEPSAKKKADPKAPDADDKTPPKRVTEDLVVTATRTERTASDLPVSASVVASEAIREAPVRTVDDLVRTIPGLNLPLASSRVTFPSNLTFSMRGVGPNRGLVLLDGVPINDAFLGAVQWNKVAVASLERVEVARGGASSLFGNLALGGTLQLVSRRVDESGVAVDLSYGSYSTLLGTVRAEHRISESVGVGLIVDGYDSDGYVRSVPSDRTPLDEPYANKGINAQLRVDLGQRGGTSGFVRANVLSNRLSQGTPIGFNKKRITDLAAGGTLPVGSMGELTATAFYQDQLFEVTNAAFRANTGNSQEYVLNTRETPIHDGGASLQWSRSFAGIVPTVTAGVDLRQLDGEDRGHEFDSTGKETVYRISGGNQRFVGFFVQGSVVPSTRLEILVSGRVDTWRSYSGETVSTPGGTVTYEDSTRGTFDPRLSVRYSLADGLSARVGVYRGFRAPTLQDLYRYNLTRSQQIQPNPLLGPETMVGGDLGLDVTKGVLTGQVNLFLNRVKDQVSRVFVTNVPVQTLQPRNVGVTRSRGFELMSEVRLSPVFTVQGSYTFTEAVLVDNPPDRSIEGNQVPDVSKHFGSGSLRYRHPSGLHATLRGRAWSRRYPDASNINALPGAAVMDVLVGYPVLRGLDVTVTAENVLDRRYVVEFGSVGRRIGEPLQIFVGVRWQAPSAR